MSLADDELAIRQLVAAYADACNRKDPAAMASVYAPDGELQPLNFPGPPIKGRDKLQKLFTRLMIQRDFLFLTIFSGIVNVDGDTATGRWWIGEMKQVTGEDRIINMLAVVQDEVVRLEEGWRFSRRKVKPVFNQEIAAKDLHEDPPPYDALDILPRPR